MQTLNSNLAPLEVMIKDVLRPIVEKVDRWQDMTYFLRRMEGLTQEEYAERISVSRVTVEYWETGRTIAGARSRRSMFLQFQIFIIRVCGSGYWDDELTRLVREVSIKIFTLNKM